MKYEEITFNGEYNSEGSPIYLGKRNLENTFDQATIEKIVTETERRVSDINNAILSAETNIKINSDILEKLKTEEIFSDDTVNGAEIYFRNVKELKAIQGALPKVEEELARWKETLNILLALNIQNKDAGETNNGGETVSQEVINPAE